MPRRRILKVGALNVVTHPHSALHYAKLFSRAYALQTPTKIRGADWGLLASLSATVKDKDKEPPGLMGGTIFRFLNIDQNEPWLNLNTRKAVDPNEAPDVPMHLKPHLRFAHFVFFPKGHRIFFDSTHLAPNNAQQLFESLFRHETLVREFGQVSVHIETDRDEFEKLISIAHKQKVFVDITLPNPDDPGADEQEVINRMDGQNIRRKVAVYTARTDEGIHPDEQTAAEMKAARSNGILRVIGRDENNRRVEGATTHIPWRLEEQYEEGPSVLEKLSEVGLRVIRNFRRGG